MHKARGWLYEKTGKMKFYCHNCNASMSFEFFLRTLDNNLYNEYKLEKLSNGSSGFHEPKKLQHSFGFDFRPVFEKSDALKPLTRVSALNHNDPMKKYIVDRKIPSEYHYKLFIANKFMKYVNELLPNKFGEEALRHDEPRLVIPFIDKDSKVHALQGRSFRNVDNKYITIVLDDTKPKLYGLDTLRDGKTYVVEGPIDSMFLDNAVATAGGDLLSAQRVLNRDDMIVVYDNERRSKETVAKMKKSIQQGFKVCFWPENVVYKDINDMVKLGNMSKHQIMEVIDANTYCGLKAEMELSKWKRVAV